MIEWSNVCKHPQGWDYDLGETISEDGAGVFDINILVHHDTYYPRQSSAKVLVWSDRDLGWHRVTSLLWQVWAANGAPSRAGNGSEGGWEAADELRARAVAVLFADSDRPAHVQPKSPANDPLWRCEVCGLRLMSNMEGSLIHLSDEGHYVFQPHYPTLGRIR